MDKDTVLRIVAHELANRESDSMCEYPAANDQHGADGWHSGICNAIEDAIRNAAEGRVVLPGNVSVVLADLPPDLRLR